MDALGRRTRWHRDGTKAVQLRPRDRDIFSLLQRYRYLSSDYLYAFIGGDESRFLKRLGDLFVEPNCFVERPEREPARRHFNADYRPIVYELEDKGHDELNDGESYVWLNRGREHRTYYPHSVMVCQALANIELGIRKDPTLRFIPWPEIYAKMPEETRHSQLSHCLPVSISHEIEGKVHRSNKALLPDAVFGIEYIGHGVKFFALECDRNNEPTRRRNLEETSYLRKLLQYKAVVHGRVFKTHWGLPNLLVLNVFNDAGHLDDIKTLTQELTGKGASYLLFGTMASIGDFEKPPAPDGRLLSMPWQRVGYCDFNINSPTGEEKTDGHEAGTDSRTHQREGEDRPGA